MESDAAGVDRISGYLVSDTMENYAYGILDAMLLEDIQLVFVRTAFRAAPHAMT